MLNFWDRFECGNSTLRFGSDFLVLLPANTLWALSALTNIKYLVHKYASETHLRPFCVCVLLLIPSSGLFSLRFHGSAERAIASASVWRRGDAALGGCGQTPGSAVTRGRAGGGQESGSGGGGVGGEVVNRCAEDGLCRRR